MTVGWYKDQDYWYYLYQTGRWMAMDWVKINSHWYYFYGFRGMVTDTIIDGRHIESNGIPTLK